MAALGPLSRRISASAPIRFGVALFATLFALFIPRSMHDLASGFTPYITALAAIAISTWLCGTGPAIASFAISLLTINYGFIPVIHLSQIMHITDRVNLLAFFCVGLVLIAIGESTHRGWSRLQSAAGTLEQKICERTDELDQANLSLRQLSGRLLNLQDEERRRIARELHDNAGQALSALAMNLGAVAEDLERLIKTAGVVADSASMVQDMSDDIRTMSYLLHPPLLDEMGLVPALTWYVEGFAKRSRIAVNLECGQDFGRLSREAETALFRIVQECLTNIHRHSGSPTASIEISRSDSNVRLRVSDRGKGIAPEMRNQMKSGGAVGVGVRGMSERVRQLGGSLEITSNGPGTGTCIVVELPFSEVNPTHEAASAAAAG